MPPDIRVIDVQSGGSKDIDEIFADLALKRQEVINQQASEGYYLGGMVPSPIYLPVFIANEHLFMTVQTLTFIFHEPESMSFWS